MKLQFRVWDIVNKQFSYPRDKQFLIGLDGKLYDGNGNPYDEKHIIQLYTGINDLWDQPIYCGDIVKETWKENQPYGYCPDEIYDMENRFVVEYIDYAFNLEPKRSREQTCVENFRREIIGNIFETPDLLKK